MDKNKLQNIFLYLKDKLSGKERYKLEKEMNKDPFLADAMEGLSDHDPEALQQDIQKLRKELNAKSQEQKKSLYANLRIAAGIIILLGIGGIIIILTVPNLTKNQIAQQIEQEEPKAFKEDKIYSTEKEVFELEEEIPPVTRQQNMEGETQPKEVTKDDIAIVDDDVLIEDSEPDLDESTLIEETKQAEEPIKKFAFQEEEEEVHVTETELASAEKSRAKKSKGNIAAFQKTDSNRIAENKLEDEQIITADEAINTTERKAIAAQPQAAMKEQLAGEAMPETNTLLKVELSYPAEREGIQHARPDGGIEKLQSYLEEELQTNFAYKKLIIEFSVNSEGAIDSPRVIEKESKKEAKQIIELLVKGPKWYPAIYKEQTVGDKIRMSIIY